MLPKACNKYSIDAVIKYEHMIQGYHFYLASVSENSGLTILKVTQFSKAPALDSLSGFFLKNGVKCVTKPITDLCNLSINSKEFPDLRKVAKRKLLYKNGSLIEPSNYKPISCYPNIQTYQKSHSWSEFKKFIIHLPIWFSKKSILQIYAIIIWVTKF